MRLPWKNASLLGVSAFSPSDVWAVGTITGKNYPNGPEIPLSVHWDGRSWRRVPLPPIPGFAWLADVIDAAPGDAWAVGGGGKKTRPLLAHWDGSRWHRINLDRIAPALGSLSGIDARTPGDVWAAGMEGDLAQESYGYTDYVLRWDGHGWRRVTSPLSDVNSDAYANALDVGLTGDVWTLNYDFSGTGPTFVVWSSPKRTARAFDMGADQDFKDIAAISRGEVWLVGSSNPKTPLIAHWIKGEWHFPPTPFMHYSHVGLNAISAISADDIWAVGTHLIVRYSR
jgi:hypothetical protein